MPQLFKPPVFGSLNLLEKPDCISQRLQWRVREILMRWVEDVRCSESVAYGPEERVSMMRSKANLTGAKSKMLRKSV